MTRLAVILLIDRRGWVLLQERDSEAPRAADQWGMVGGHVEDGEDFESAAHRELAEETGLKVPAGDLQLWSDAEFSYSDGFTGHYQVFVGSCDHTDADVVVGEGRRIVFVDPEQVPTLDLSDSAAHFVPAFLASPTYQRLLGGSR